MTNSTPNFSPRGYGDFSSMGGGHGGSNSYGGYGGSNFMGGSNMMGGMHSGNMSDMLNPSTMPKGVLDTAGGMQSQFVQMIDDRIRQAFACYFREMPEFMCDAIKEVFHHEGASHLGKAKDYMESEFKHRRPPYSRYGEEEKEEEGDEHHKIGKFYAHVLKHDKDLVKLSASNRCERLKERYPKLSPRCISHLAAFLGQPDIGSIAESEGVDLEEVCRK